MESCPKVKNPCKICLLAVTNKNGLQCQGACRKWAHFTCLNYTPGKIQDIKSGIITVTCPCPDCLSEEPKEFLTNPPYTCTNHQCPANKQPVCEEIDCPTKRKAALQPVSSESCPGTPDDITPPSSARLPAGARAPPCGFPKPLCGPQPSCPPQNPCSMPKPPCPPQPPLTPPEPPCIVPKTPCSTPKPKVPRLPVAPCGPSPPCSKNKLPKVSPMKPPPCPILTPCPSKDGKKALRPQPCSCRSMQPPIMHQCPSGIKLQMIPSSDSSTCPPAPCGPDAPCASSDSSVAITPPVMRPCPVLESRPVKKTKSCSCASKDGEDSKMRLFKTSSEVHVASTNSVYITMQEMCNTVGQLSSQLKQLMCKMMDTVPNT
ncbi:vegetative cell wall protein gp1 [Manduca sexta]|uniref:PHD-type domain-containing protein n=1 Tax=Manduca sexta TaxID=7130 RepID=A0A922CMX0_MANSE|nr:vegetative cell wall protein gp1 [Manduca sexta]KAG6451248.1 hypothetical protein O3G_MSEX007029 [Manduca sexta]